MNDYKVGEGITDIYAVKKSNITPARNGSNYLDLKLVDIDKNVLPAKQWDYSGPVPPENTVIKVKAMVNVYLGQKQLIVQKWEEAKLGDYVPGIFLPRCPTSRDDLLMCFFGLVDEIQDSYYTDIMRYFVASEYFDPFTVAPGAKTIHHAYIGGLLEHSIDVAGKCIRMADQNIKNMDLLVTGALLHDIGKIKEYDWSGCVFTKTNQGYLLGHIALGLMMLEKYDTGRDPEKFMLLAHMIASHHGELEFGSPVEPQTREAVILHTADMLDFQANVIDAAVEGAAGKEWTGRIQGLGREFYVGRAAKAEIRDALEIEFSDNGDALEAMFSDEECPF